MKLLMLTLLFLTTIGCGTMNQASLITDSRNAWVNMGRAPSVDVYWCEAKEGQKPTCEKPITK